MFLCTITAFFMSNTHPILQVTVGAEHPPGSKLKARTPHGRDVEVTIPVVARAGETVSVLIEDGALVVRRHKPAVNPLGEGKGVGVGVSSTNHTRPPLPPTPPDAGRAPHSDGDTDDEPTGGAEEEWPDGRSQPIYQALFQTPRYGKMRATIARLYADRLCLHRTETDASPEQTIWLHKVTDVTLHRLEHDSVLPFQVHLTLGARSLRLASRGDQAKRLVEKMVEATEQGADRGRAGKPLGLQSAVLRYSRYQDYETSAAGRVASELVAGIAQQAGKLGAVSSDEMTKAADALVTQAASSAEYAFSGSLLVQEADRWVERFIELTADKTVVVFTSPHRGQPLRTLPLSEYGVMPVRSKVAGRPFAFELTSYAITSGPSDRLLVAAPHAELAASWVSRLEAAISATSDSRLQTPRTPHGHEVAEATAAEAAAKIERRRARMREAVAEAQRKARLAARAVGRLAVEMHLDAELLRTRLLEWDFDSESKEIDDIRRAIAHKVRVLSHSLLGTMTYAAQLQKVTTVNYQRSLLAGWPRSGYMRKPDFKKGDADTWATLCWAGRYNRRFFALDGTDLRYFVPSAEQADSSPVLSDSLLVAPAAAAEAAAAAAGVGSADAGAGGSSLASHPESTKSKSARAMLLDQRGEAQTGTGPSGLTRHLEGGAPEGRKSLVGGGRKLSFADTSRRGSTAGANRLSRCASNLVSFSDRPAPTWPKGMVVLTRTALLQSRPHEGDESNAVPLLLHKRTVVAPSDAAPHAFVVTGQYDRALLLAARSDAERDAWIAKIRSQVGSYFFAAQKARGTVDLKGAEEVRKSTAPGLPSTAIDIVGAGGLHIYTLLPETREEQLRWICVLSQAIAQQRRKPDAPRPADSKVHLVRAGGAARPSLNATRDAALMRESVLRAGGSLVVARDAATVREAAARYYAGGRGVEDAASSSPSSARAASELTLPQARPAVGAGSLRDVPPCGIRRAPRSATPTANQKPQRSAQDSSQQVPQIQVVAAGSLERGLLSSPDDEAIAISEALAAGQLVTFKLRANHSSEDCDADGGQRQAAHTAAKDTYLWSSVDPAELTLFDLGAHGGGPKENSLQASYDGWREEQGFSLATPEGAWRRALDTLRGLQEERYLQMLTLLEVEHRTDSVVALLRIHNHPSEFVAPLRFADVAIVWSPQRDKGTLGVADRATVNAVSVSQLLGWCSTYGATAQSVLRADAADTDQQDGASLHFDTVLRKVFMEGRAFL